MSYINDALHKVQKDKDSSYAPYGDLFSAPGKKPVANRIWSSVIGLAVIFVFAVGIAVLLYWPAIRPASREAAAVPSPMAATDQPGLDNGIGEIPPAVVPIPAATEPAPEVTPVSAEKTPDALPAEISEQKRGATLPNASRKSEAPSQTVPDDPARLYAQALQKQREDKLADARDLYKKVIAMQPRNLQALNNLGVVYLKQNAYKGAISSFSDALDIKYDYVDAHYNLACLYARKGDTKKSLFYLKNAIGFNPDVRQWAAHDDDLKSLANLSEFRNLIQAQD